MRLSPPRLLVVMAPLLLLACGDNGTDERAPWELEVLTPDQGFTLQIPEFEVEAGRESQNCYFVQVPDINNGEDVYINRFVIGLNPGSHHMNVFRVRTIIDLRPEDGAPTTLGEFDATVIEGEDFFETHPCWDSANWADWPLVANSQHSTVDDPFTDWVLPDGVAQKFAPGEMLMVQTHYVNTTDQPAPFGAKVAINFHKYPDSAPPMEMGSLFATQQEIRICQSSPNVTYSGTCGLPDGATIAAANGHFHKRGRQFTIYAWDGASIEHPDAAAQFYESNSWDEPPMAINLDVQVPGGGGIWWDCAYQWLGPTVETCADVNEKDPLQEGDCCYSFGGNTDVGEHCNVFLYYYPRGETDVYCN